jgi:hypothetical protein
MNSTRLWPSAKQVATTTQTHMPLHTAGVMMTNDTIIYRSKANEAYLAAQHSCQTCRGTHAKHCGNANFATSLKPQTPSHLKPQNPCVLHKQPNSSATNAVFLEQQSSHAKKATHAHRKHPVLPCYASHACLVSSAAGRLLYSRGNKRNTL